MKNATYDIGMDFILGNFGIGFEKGRHKEQQKVVERITLHWYEIIQNIKNLITIKHQPR